VINLRRPQQYSPLDGARFEVHFEKARGFDGDDAQPFEATLTCSESKLTWNFRNIENRGGNIRAQFLHNFEALMAMGFHGTCHNADRSYFLEATWDEHPWNVRDQKLIYSFQK
jgi:hypothetical protein